MSLSAKEPKLARVRVSAPIQQEPRFSSQSSDGELSQLAAPVASPAVQLPEDSDTRSKEALRHYRRRQRKRAA